MDPCDLTDKAVLRPKRFSARRAAMTAQPHRLATFAHALFVMVVILLSGRADPSKAAETQFAWQSPSIGLSFSCSGTTPLVCTLPKGATFGTFQNQAYAGCVRPGPNGCYAVHAPQLLFHGQNFGNGSQGYPIISGVSFSRMGYLSISATIAAYCGPTTSTWCFAGLTLYDGESDYREISYDNISGDANNIAVHRVAPYECGAPAGCDSQLINSYTGLPLAVGQNQYHELRLDYLGETNGSSQWIYYVDGVVEQVSPGNSSDIAPLQGNPHAAVFLIGTPQNVGYSGTYVEGTMGPISVYSGLAPDQSQPVQANGYGLSTNFLLAQQIIMGASIPNTAVASLFLVAGGSYRVSAFTDVNSQPGTLINTTSYVAPRTGLQDVPLWLGLHVPSWWLVVSGSNGSQIGVTNPGSQLYPGGFKYSINGGASWIPLSQNLTFQTFARE